VAHPAAAASGCAEEGIAVTAIRTLGAAVCVAAAVTLVGALACSRAATRYETRLQLQLAQTYEGRCVTSSPSPSLAARAGLRLTRNAVSAERLALSAHLLRLGLAQSCRAVVPDATGDQPTSVVSTRVPYHQLLGRARALARHDRSSGRADTLGLLGLTLVRTSTIDPVNASAFVAEAEKASREAVQLHPLDSLLQTNLEVVLRLQQQDEQARRRANSQAQRRMPTPPKAADKRKSQAKTRPLPGPGRDGAGGY